MAAPGVGPFVALTYRACVDNPARFGRSKCGDAMMRAALYEAALVLLTGSRGRWSTLKAWGMAQRPGAAI